MTNVFTTDTVHTPVNVPGWTVQNSATGSDQSTISGTAPSVGDIHGAVGPAGPAGAKGDKGDTGTTGAAGTNGTNGTNGTTPGLSAIGALLTTAGITSASAITDVLAAFGITGGA